MIGDNIRQLREAMNITQQELAYKLNVTPKAISFYELNQRNPSIENLCMHVKILNTTPNYLIGWEE